jgi:hypothetical protein
MSRSANVGNVRVARSQVRKLCGATSVIGQTRIGKAGSQPGPRTYMNCGGRSEPRATSPILLALTLSWVRQPLIFEGPRHIRPEKYILPSVLLALAKALDQIDLSANRKSQWRSVKSLGADRPKGFPFSKAAFVACHACEPTTELTHQCSTPGF